MEAVQTAHDWQRVYPVLIVQEIEGFAPHEVDTAGIKHVLFSHLPRGNGCRVTDPFLKVTLTDIEAICAYEDVSTYYFFYSPSTRYIKIVWTAYDPEQDTEVYDEIDDVIGYVCVLGESSQSETRIHHQEEGTMIHQTYEIGRRTVQLV
jgi:hypothetical protein